MIQLPQEQAASGGLDTVATGVFDLEIFWNINGDISIYGEDSFYETVCFFEGVVGCKK